MPEGEPHDRDHRRRRGGIVAFLADRTFAVITARRTRSSSAPPTPHAAQTPPTGAARPDSSASTAAGSGGGIRTLHLSGTAEVEWDAPGRPGDEGQTGRRAVFTLRRLVAGHPLPSRQVADTPCPRLPVLTD
jgi:hypothetical protein